jgi:hypothetical protein
MYWAFELWASNTYYYNPTTIPSIALWQLQRDQLEKKKSSSRATLPSALAQDDATMELTALSFIPSGSTAPPCTQFNILVKTTGPDFTAIDIFGNRSIPQVQPDLFGGTIFDDPNFHSSKLTPEERAADKQ